MKYLGMSKGMFNPKNFVDGYNAIVAGAITVLSGILGQYWYLFIAFAGLNILDWASGWYRSRRLKEESSQAGLAGIVKKVWYWAVIAMAFGIAHVIDSLGGDLAGVDLSFLAVIGWFTLACLAVNEARSIVENLVQAGINVPGILVKGLAIADKLLKDKEKQILPEDE